MEFTEQQISDFLVELKRQAALNGTPSYICGLNWNPLEDIAGEQAHRVFFILQKRGLLREEVLPGCYSESIDHFTTN